VSTANRTRHTSALLVIVYLLRATPAGSEYGVDLGREGSDASERVGTVLVAPGGWSWMRAPAEGVPVTVAALVEEVLAERFGAGV